MYRVWEISVNSRGKRLPCKVGRTKASRSFKNDAAVVAHEANDDRDGVVWRIQRRDKG